MRQKYQKYQVFFWLCLLLVATLLVVTAVDYPKTIVALTDERPTLDGRPQALVIPATEQLPTCSPAPLLPCSRSTLSVPTQMSEGFEGQWPSIGWLLVDQSGSDGGEFLWGKRDCHPRTGGFAGWATGGGAQGSAFDCTALYPNNLYTWIIYGPFDLSQATAASMTYYFWGESEVIGPCGEGDWLFVGSSSNGAEFTGSAICGDWLNGSESNGYNQGILDLTSRLGQSQVWVALTMISDGTGVKQGFMIDDVVLEADITPTCRTPAVPILSAPANGSTTADQAPAFDWNDVQDSSVYNFALYDEAPITTPVITATLDNSGYIPISPLAADTYFWRIRAHNAADGCDEYSAWSDVFSVTITVLLDPPTLAEIDNPDDNGDYMVSWSAVGGATSYTVEEQQDAGFWIQIYGGPDTILEATDRPEGQWCYRANAVNMTGSSNWSNVVCTVVIGIVAPTADFEADPQSGTVPLEVTFRNTSSGNYTSCAWDYGDGQSGTTCAEYHNHSYQQVGLYTVELTVSGAKGSSTTARNDYIAVSRRCRTLSVGHSGGGNEPVTTPPASAGCLAGEYVPGAWVDLVAIPDEGWKVSVWSGTDDDSSKATTNRLTMPDGNHTVTIQYELACYLLERGHEGQGDNPAADPEHSEMCANNEYYAGEIIMLAAAPADGWWVARWDGTANNGSDDRRNTLTMPAADHSVTVYYQSRRDLRRLYLPLAVAPGFYFAGPWETEPNNVEGEANGPIYLDRNYFGYPNDQEDYFRFDLPTAATVFIELSNHTGDDPQLQLYYNSVTLSNLVGAATAFPYHVEFTGQRGIYFVRIVAVGNYNGTTPYSLRISSDR